MKKNTQLMQCPCSPPQIPVTKKDGKWVIVAPCPRGHSIGTSKDDLLTGLCDSCEYNKLKDMYKKMDEKWEETKAEKEYEDMAKADGQTPILYGETDSIDNTTKKEIARAEEQKQPKKTAQDTGEIPPLAPPPVDSSRAPTQMPEPVKEATPAEAPAEASAEVHGEAETPNEDYESLYSDYYDEDNYGENFPAGWGEANTTPPEMPAPPVPQSSVPSPSEAPRAVGAVFLSKGDLKEPKQKQENPEATAVEKPQGDIFENLQKSFFKITAGVEAINEAELDIDGLMQSIGVPGGPSEGGLSSHVLMDAACPRRAYYVNVLGLEPRVKGLHFNIGSLFHAAMAVRYSEGRSQQYRVFDPVIQAGGTQTAREARRLTDIVDKYGTAEETKTWCSRAVEYNLVFWLPPIKLNGKMVRIPLCGRIDYIVGLKQPHEPCPSFGPMPQGVYLVDHKTTGTMNANVIRGYGVEYQFLLYGTGYIESNHEDVFGKLNGFMVNLIAKKPIKYTKDNLFHGRVPLPVKELTDFYQNELIPDATRLYTNLARKDREDMSLWPKKRKLCQGKWGMCKYFEICSTDNIHHCDYVQNQKRIIDVTELQEPPRGTPNSILLADKNHSVAVTTNISADAKKSKKAEQKKEVQKELVKVMAEFICGLIEQPTEQDDSPFNKNELLGPGCTEKKTKSLCLKKLKELYIPSVGWEFPISAPQLEEPNTFQLKTAKTGFKTEGYGLKLSITFNQIATEVARMLYDVTRLEPIQ